MTGPSLNSADKVELSVIGAALAHIDALIDTNDLNIEAGCVEAGGSVNAPFDDLTIYGGIITYKTNPIRANRADAHISSYPNLKLFSEVAVKSMYARGIEL